MSISYKLLLLFIIFLTLPLNSHCQFEDATWTLGTGLERNPVLPPYGGTDFLFLPDSTHLKYVKRAMDFDNVSASICSPKGNLLFYTNGDYVLNSNHELLENGNGLINPSNLGSRIPQGVIIVPIPETSSSYYIIHGYDTISKINGVSAPYMKSVLYTRVNMNGNNGNGVVESKNNVLINAEYSWGKITAVKHGNGRDWWLVIPSERLNRIHLFLINPNGIQNFGWLGIPFNRDSHAGLGNAVFSQSGNNYIICSRETLNSGFTVDILSFDRCNGSFASHQQFHEIDTQYAINAAVSYNEKYLYITTDTLLFQYNLTSPDIKGSKKIVGVYDNFVGYFPTHFDDLRLALDRKIYVNVQGGSEYMHVINNPDSTYQNINFNQHSVKLPSINFRAMPNFPNFRQTTLYESACDTLNITYPPTAKFRYELVDPDSSYYQFIDLSAFYPDSWSWDFGDGNTTTQQNPTHNFESSGHYQVCLKVHNDFGEDTTCWDLNAVTTSIDNIINIGTMRVFPSPNQGNFTIENIDSKSHIQLYNLSGQEVKFQRNQNQLHLTHPYPGIYILQLMDNKGNLKYAKFIVR